MKTDLLVFTFQRINVPKNNLVNYFQKILEIQNNDYVDFV